jgi:hypothetical protein
MLTQTEQRILMLAQVGEIQRHKWIQSEKAGYDLGQAAEFDWIDRFAAAYRVYYTKLLLRQRLEFMIRQRLG